MVTSTEDKKSIRALQKEISELKAQLAASQRWSKAWKKLCIARRQTHTETLLKCMDLLDPVVDHVMNLNQDIYNSMAVSAFGEAGQAFEVHVSEQDRVAAILRAVNRIEKNVRQCVFECAKEFNDAPGDVTTQPKLRLVYRKS